MTEMQRLKDGLEREAVAPYEHLTKDSMPEHVVLASIAVSLADISRTLRQIEKKMR